MTRYSSGAGQLRYHRHGEAFWRDLIAQQAKAGLGERKFCLANGVASDTFHKWRAALAERTTVTVPAVVPTPASVSTPNAMFIPLLQEYGGATEAAPEPVRGRTSKDECGHAI